MKPAAVNAPETRVAMARGSDSQNARPARAAPAAPAPAAGAAVSRPPLDRVVAEAPDGAEDVSETGLRRVDGHRQRRRPEVDVGAAHAALLAQRALQLHGAVGAVHAGDVEDAPFAAVLTRHRSREVERPVLVRGERAVVLAVRLGAGAPGERLDRRAFERALVEADAEEAARHVRLDGVDAVQAEELAADLVHAAAALGGPWQQQRQLEVPLGHAGDPSSPPVVTERLSGPCSTCSRVMSSRTRMCASSGE